MRTLLAVLALASLGYAQDKDSPTLSTGNSEFGFYAGGAKSIPGGAPGSHNYFEVAGRWSRVMAEFGGGAFEYGVEVIPVMVVGQTKTTYAYGFSPLELRYNFFSKHKVVPYLEIGGGILGSTQQLPENTLRFNFIDQAALGVQWLRKGSPSFSAGVKYQHISNASIGDHNPGINSMFVFGGFSWWKR